MELRQLRLFLAVAETGNFTRAAERVHLSQPALSHRIHQLEDELGVNLFERTPRGATLTPAGAALVADARHLLGYAEASVRRVRRAGGITDDSLRVGFDFVEFGSVPPMPSLLGAFRARFPEAQVNIQTLVSEELEQALVEERLDLGFMLGPPLSTDLGFYALLKGAYHVLLPVTHPLAAAEQVSLLELLNNRLLLPKLSVRDDAALLAFLQSNGKAPKVVYKGADMAAFGGLVAAGEGVAVLPSGLLKGQVGPETVVRPLAEPTPLWTFGLAWLRSKPPFFADLGQYLIAQLVPQPVVI